MTREEIINTLHKIEQDLATETWVYKDIQFWPVLKRDLFFALFEDVQEKKPDTLPKYTKIIKKGREVLDSIVYNFKNLFRRYEQTDTLYFGFDAHRIDFNGKRINRYFYPLNNKSIFYFEYDVVKKNIYPKRHYNLYKAGVLYNFYYRLVLKNDFNDIIKQFNLFDIEKYFPEYNALVRSIILKQEGILHSIYGYTILLRKIMIKLKPKEIIGLCYYNTPMYAVHFVANAIGIKNIDMQHGGQGVLHPMYYFKKFPDKGYNTLPQYFWLWDKPSKKNIDEWLSTNNHHKAELKGNPWIDFIKTHTDKAINTQKKIILYTLQQEYLDSYILEAIQKTTSDFEWWLRLHPRMKEAKTKIENQLSDINALNKINLKEANDLSLPMILKETYIHLSKFSGSVIEAEQMGVKTIVLESIGVKNFSDYIEWGNCIGLEFPTSHEILKIIQDD